MYKSEKATTSDEKETEISEKSVKNKIVINPDIAEAKAPKYDKQGLDKYDRSKRMIRHKQDKYGVSTLKQRIMHGGVDHNIDNEKKAKSVKEGATEVAMSNKETVLQKKKNKIDMMISRERNKELMKKEQLELDENRRAARSAGGYKDDSKKQTDPSKDGFTGISGSIKDIMRQNKEIEAKNKMKKEHVSFAELLERTRYAKETGKDFKTGNASEKGGTRTGKTPFDKVSREMRKTGGVMSSRGKGIQPQGKKKEKGKKGYKGVTPVDKIKNRLAQKRAAKPNPYKARAGESD